MIKEVKSLVMGLYNFQQKNAVPSPQCNIPEHGEMQQSDRFADDTEIPVGSVHIKAAVQRLVQKLQLYHAA